MSTEITLINKIIVEDNGTIVTSNLRTLNFTGDVTLTTVDNDVTLSIGGSSVTSVTATLPLLSSGGLTPNLSIYQASPIQDGYLSATDWNTFNNKGTGSVTSVGITVPSAFTVSNSPITTSGTINIGAAGLASQYVRGDGQLSTFPEISGGGSSVNYYLNGGVNQGTFGGNPYYQISQNANTGTAVNFNLTSGSDTVYFLTDVNDPDQLTIPSGSWICRMYFSQNNNSGNCTIQPKLYKYDGTNFTLLATGSPESITNSTTIDLYTFTIAIPSGITLLSTDRLAIGLTAGNFGGSRTVTLYTQDSRLAQLQTTYSIGVVTLNGLSKPTQYFSVGSAGTDVNIFSTAETHTFNFPTASSTNRGVLSTTDWNNFNSKEPSITSGTTSQYWRGDKSWQTLDKSAVGLSNVENTALSTWGGSGNITTVGTISSGVWNGSPILDSYISSVFLKADGSIALTADWNAGSYRITTGNVTSTGDMLVNNITIGRGPNNIANNTVLGEQAFNSNISGGNNTTVGYQAGFSASGVYSLTAFGYQSALNSTVLITAFGSQSALGNTTGIQNTAIGHQTLQNNSTGNSNTAVGFRSLLNNTSGPNTGVGAYSLRENTTGSGNTGIGYGVLQSTTTGSYLAALGMDAGVNNTTGNYNTFVGYESAFNNTTGNNIIAIGSTALYSNLTGSSLIAIGRNALYNSTADSNNAIGLTAMYLNTTGTVNDAFGQEVLYNNISGNYNVAFGYRALFNNETGSNNIGIGSQAGAFLSNGSSVNTTPNQSIFIGINTKSLNATDTNQIVIGYNTIGNGTNTTTIGAQGVTIDTYLAGYLHVNNAYRLPNTDGTANQILKTNGSGIVTWQADSGGIALTDLSATSPLTYNNTTGVFGIQVANTSQSGYLNNADWNTFNGKQTAYTILSTLGALSNSSGWLKNNGSGVLSYSTPTKADVGLSNVENTALSTWVGTNTITTLGTITVGVWNAGAITDTYISSSANWNSAYTNRITSLTTTGNSGSATLSSNILNIPTYTLGGLGGLALSGGTMTGNLILNADPTASLGAATKQYVDNLITGITWKNSCIVATTSNITLSGFLTIDGVSLTTGNRVLVKNQSTASDNGIYVVASGVWSRATDVSTSIELETATVAIEQGSTYKNTQWTCTTTNVTIGVTPITFGQISGAGTYSAGSGLSLISNSFSISNLGVTNAMLAGSISASKLIGTDINTVGTIASGVWQGTAIADSYISSAATWNAKQNVISVTTTGSSGSATFIGTTLNIPTYTLAGLGGISLTSLTASTPLSYNNSSGAFSIQQATTSQSGYLSSTDWNTFNNKGSGSVTSVAALTIGTTGTDISSTVANGTTTPVITLNIPTASASNRGALSSTDWSTFNGKQAAISLTTTGNSGSATFISNTINIPTYTLAGLGGISLTALSASSPLFYNNTTGVFTIQAASGSQGGYLTSSDWTTFNNKQSALSGTGFVKISGTTISYDNSTYLTANQTITLSGDISGSGSTSISTSISASTVTGKLITGFVSGAGTITTADSILTAINKLDGNIANKQSTLVSGTNIKTVAGVSLLGSGDIGAIGDTYISSATTWNSKQAGSTILTNLSTLSYVSGTPFIKMTGANTFALDTNTYITGNQTITLNGDITGSGATSITTSISASTVTGKAITGFVSGSGTVSAADSILTAINKLDGNTALKAPLASPALTGTPTAPTATPLTNNTQVATTAYVDAAVTAGGGGSGSFNYGLANAFTIGNFMI